MLERLAEAVFPDLSGVSGAGGGVLAGEFGEGVECHGAAERIAEESAGVERLAVAFWPCVHDAGATDAGGDGEAAAEGFAEANEVGVNVLRLVGEKRARAEEARENFIENENHAVLVAPAAEGREKFGRWDDDAAAALDRLDEDGGDFSRGELAEGCFERFPAVGLRSGRVREEVRNRSELGGKGIAKPRNSRAEEGAVAESVVAASEADDVGALGGEAGGFEGGLDGIGAGIAEERFSGFAEPALKRERAELLAEGDFFTSGVDVAHGVNELRGLCGKGWRGKRVSERGDTERAGEVEQAIAVSIPDVATFGALPEDWPLLIGVDGVVAFDASEIGGECARLGAGNGGEQVREHGADEENWKIRGNFAQASA